MTSTEVDTMDVGSLRAAYKVLMNEHQALALLSQHAPAERNQCDGCQAGLPTDENGNHRMGGSGGYADLMRCQQGRYRQAPAEQEPFGYIRRASADAYSRDELGIRCNIVKTKIHADCVALYTAPIAANPTPAELQRAAWLPPETAPRDRLILADMGCPWTSLAVWNEPSGQWCVTELECDLYQGQWNDTVITHTFEPHTQMRGWMELPGLPKMEGTALPRHVQPEEPPIGIDSEGGSCD